MSLPKIVVKSLSGERRGCKQYNGDCILSKNCADWVKNCTLAEFDGIRKSVRPTDLEHIKCFVLY